MALPTPSKTDNNLLSTYLTSPNLSQNIIALNVLLKASSSFDENHALNEGGEHVVEALVSVFERNIGWERWWDEYTRDLRGDDVNPPKKKRQRIFGNGNGCDDDGFDDMVSKVWIPVEKREIDESSQWYNEKLIRWCEYCERTLSPPSDSTHPNVGISKDNAKIVEAVVMIVRNLSFVAGNVRFLCHSEGMLRVLSACLHYRPSNHQTTPITSSSESSSTSSSSSTQSNNNANSQPAPRNACLNSLQTLANLSPFLDISAKKIFADQVLVEPDKHSSLLPRTRHGHAHSLGLGGILLAKRFDIHEKDLPSHVTTVLHSICRDHVLVISSLFSTLSSVVCHTTRHRAVVFGGLELLKELVDNTDNASVFLRIPNELLSRLVELLYVPRLGPDSLEYIDPTFNLVSRVSALKLTGGYDASVDFEARDRALELLEKLSALSPDIKRRLGSCAGGGGSIGTLKIFDYLLPVLETTVGRSDAPQLAGRVLGHLAMVAENRVGLKYVEMRLVHLAGKDAHVA
eukprot:CAMPEP_0172518010 /NCGR_PEP_ID=MMETSP1066-20121228/289796_1 /TAXON_ID=671091 /ORGANISM="Coscinodiscus wailesii, Strain CCMP2513" /LENGTH=515 /DNA_ID=CAMNT_0013300279 /DNA_START=97 /DNA_END=1640 /DNA_ORIENTATION=+